MSHTSWRVPPNLRVQLFRLFSRNPHDSCIPCKEKHGLQCYVRSTIAMIKTCHNAFLSFLRNIITTTVAVTFHLQSTSNSILCNVCVCTHNAYIRGMGINVKRCKITITAIYNICNSDCPISRWKLFNEYFDQDSSANGFSILMERNDSFLNDRDKCALFASMSFTTAGKERGGDWFNASRQARGDAWFFVSVTVFMRR